MSDVFISHAHSTNALTRRIADALRSLGYDVWWDDDIPMHRAFAHEIDQRVRDAKAVLVIWSDDAVNSKRKLWVRSEASVGLAAGNLIQISVDGTVPPMPFDQVQYADLNGWDGDTSAPNWQKVIASVNALVNTQDAPTTVGTAPEPARSRSIVSRKIIAAAFAALAAVGSVAIWYVSTRSSQTSAIVPSQASTVSGAAHDAASKPDAVFGDRPAIAVLPFENRSDDPQHAIFADGLAEDLIARLSAWRAFPVIARSSSFQYRGDVDIKRIAKELNVRYVVQGSVRRTSARIRVSAQLIDARSGSTTWSQTYDRPVADVFDLQDEISAAIAAPLVGDLSRAEANRAERRGTRNLDAWSLYELGEQHLARLTLEEVATARGLYEQAIAIEPQFASAHARLAFTYIWESQFRQNPPEQNLARALTSARRALELDPLDAYAHEALGFTLLLGKDTRNGLASIQRAVELNPSLPEAWSNLGYAKWLSGDPQGCIDASERAIRLSPNDPYVVGFHQNISDSSWELGRFDAGLEHAQIMVAANPGYFWGYIDVALNAVGLARLDEARAAIEKARQVQPGLSIALEAERSGVSRPEIAARRAAALREAGLD